MENKENLTPQPKIYKLERKPEEAKEDLHNLLEKQHPI